MKKEKVIAVVILAFIVWWGYMTLHLPQSTMEGEPGPKFFPAVILGLMTIFSLILFFSGGKAKEGDEEEKAPEFSVSSIMAFYAIFFGGILLTYFFGFLAGMIIGLTAILKVVGWRLLPQAAGFSVVVTVTIYLLFDVLLQIPLPAGTLL